MSAGEEVAKGSASLWREAVERQVGCKEAVNRCAPEAQPSVGRMAVRFCTRGLSLSGQDHPYPHS